MLAAHENCMIHLSRGCLSDHPDVNLYTTYSEPTLEKFAKMKCSRGSSQQEGFHFYVHNSTMAKTVSPMLYDLFLVDIIHRWNVDRAVQANILPAFHCYDFNLLNQLHALWKNNLLLFQSNPVNGYIPALLPDTQQKERFGCSRIIDENILATFRQSLEDPGPDQRQAETPADADLLIDESEEVQGENLDELSDLLDNVSLDCYRIVEIDYSVESDGAPNSKFSSNYLVGIVEKNPYPTHVKILRTMNQT